MPHQRRVPGSPLPAAARYRLSRTGPGDPRQTPAGVCLFVAGYFEEDGSGTEFAPGRLSNTTPPSTTAVPIN
ncbi:hypothetical protein [Lysobacter gummosus]|uniref:hypothetical protein n=1 Tax=Lysobacter gummosus TaxID=262324 RepID=UPI00363C7C3F